MDPFLLRQYQKNFCNSVYNGFDDYNRLLGVLPTGAGKTVCFAKLSGHIRFQPALILAHREELVNQAADKIEAVTGIKPGIEKADLFGSKEDKIIVASIQSIMQAARLDRFDPDHFSLVVADEAHHALSDSWLKVLEYFTGAKILGVTATPHRGDKRSLGRFFEEIAYEITLFDLIRQGFLSNIRIKTFPLKIEIIPTHAGAEISDVEAAHAIDPLLGQIADIVLQHAANKKTLHFLPLIDTSERFARMLNERGLKALHIDGMDPDRKAKLAAFKRGDVMHLTNAMLLTEGYDEPSIDCINILRPTTSQPLYSQMVGRGTRIFPGKEYMLLLDFLWLHAKHKLVRPAHLIAENDKMASAMTEAMEEDAVERSMGLGDADASTDLEDAYNSAVAEREAKLRKELERKAKRAERSVDAMEYALNCHDLSLADYEADTPAKAARATSRQVEIMRKFGVDVDSVTCAGHASAIIGKFMTRARMKLATPRQLPYLVRFKHPSPHTISEAEASTWLDGKFGKHRR